MKTVVSSLMHMTSSAKPVRELSPYALPLWSPFPPSNSEMFRHLPRRRPGLHPLRAAKQDRGEEERVCHIATGGGETMFLCLSYEDKKGTVRGVCVPI